MLVVVHDDRREAQAGIKALVLSLRAHCATVPIMISCPEPDEPFVDWLHSQSLVSLHRDTSLQNMGWNVKPRLLLHFLDQGYPEVVWFDSDVILTRDFSSRFAGVSKQELLISEEFYWGVFNGGTIRTELWGLRPGRHLPFTLNSGIIRFSILPP